MESRKHYTGLTDKQVLESREKHGANVLTPPKRDSLWQIFIGNFEDPGLYGMQTRNSTC